MPYFRNFSLRTALVLYVVVPLVGAIGATSFIALWAFERQIEHRMEEDVELVAHAIRRPLSRALEQERTASVEEAVASVHEIDRVYGTYVYDLKGQPLAAVGQYNVPEPTRLVERAMRPAHGAYEEIGGQSVYSYFLPLTSSSGDPIGLLQVTRRASDIHEYVVTVRWEAVVFLLIAVLIMSGLVIFAHHGAIGRHLSRLSHGMSRVREGDREHRVALDGPREISDLGRALNTMLDSIAEAEHEIEHRREAQIALEKQLKQAEKLAAVGQLSSGIAHELGTPLAVIDGKAQRALRRDLPAAGEGALRDIRKQVRRVEHIIHQLLDFGRRNTLERREVSADKLASMTVNALREKSDRLGVVLEISGPEPPPVLKVDPPLVERALTNLLRNAIEAAPDGRVKLSWFVRDHQAGFMVDDDGPGISEEHKSRLFEPFFTTKEVDQGTGLGLAVVHGVVEEHEGKIEVQESPLGGARFVISFPLESPAR